MDILENLPTERDVPSEHQLAVRRMLAEICRPEVEARRRRRRVLVITATAGVAVATAVGATYVATRPVTDKLVIECHTAVGLSEHDLTGPNGMPSWTEVAHLREGGGVAPIEDAEGLCGELWKDGWLSFDVGVWNSDDVPPGGPFPIPELTTCVLTDGIAAVYPGTTGVCSSLGLASPTG